MLRIRNKTSLEKKGDETGFPPLHTAPPCQGLPAVETTHPFHCKYTPSMLFGPRCNHDVGILIRIPQLRSSDIKDAALSDVSAQNLSNAEECMLEAMGDHEFYCATYSAPWKNVILPIQMK